MTRYYDDAVDEVVMAVKAQIAAMTGWDFVVANRLSSLRTWDDQPIFSLAGWVMRVKNTSDEAIFYADFAFQERRNAVAVLARLNAELGSERDEDRKGTEQ